MQGQQEQQQEQQPRRERLDVPSTSQLERRLLVGDAAPRRPRQKPTIKAVAPSALLGRLQAFLPTLEAANTELQQQLEVQPASEVAMERGSDDEAEGPYVEMDLACGLFDLKDEAAVAAAERAMLAQGVAVDRFGGASTDESSSEEEDSGEGGGESSGGEAGEAAAARGGEGEGEGGGAEAMQEDGPTAAASEGDSGPADAAGAAAAGQQQAGPGRRRKGKQRSRHHAGIEELS